MTRWRPPWRIFSVSTTLFIGGALLLLPLLFGLSSADLHQLGLSTTVALLGLFLAGWGIFIWWRNGRGEIARRHREAFGAAARIRQGLLYATNDGEYLLWCEVKIVLRWFSSVVVYRIPDPKERWNQLLPGDELYGESFFLSGRFDAAYRCQRRFRYYVDGVRLRPDPLPLPTLGEFLTFGPNRADEAELHILSEQLRGATPLRSR